MAHYAYIDQTTKIVNAVIVGPETVTEPDGFGSWEKYFSAKGKGLALQTSYNTRGGVHYNPETGEPSADQSKALRYNYAGIGFMYDEDRDAFIPPKPYDSWILDEATCLWTAPIPYPADGGEYTWDESLGDWVEVVNEAT
jgi:hypothetical protein